MLNSIIVMFNFLPFEICGRGKRIKFKHIVAHSNNGSLFCLFSAGTQCKTSPILNCLISGIWSNLLSHFLLLLFKTNRNLQLVVYFPCFRHLHQEGWSTFWKSLAFSTDSIVHLDYKFRLSAYWTPTIRQNDDSFVVAFNLLYT